MEQDRVELSTPALSERCSNQLSYCSKSQLKKINKIKKAIEQTSGEYLTYNSSVINAMFFSTSTGVTENSEEALYEGIKNIDYLWEGCLDWSLCAWLSLRGISEGEREKRWVCDQGVIVVWRQSDS